MYTKELAENLNVCFNCDHHIALTAYKRIEAVSDEGSFQEFDKGMTSANPLDFPGYEEKLKRSTKDRFTGSSCHWHCNIRKSTIWYCCNGFKVSYGEYGIGSR